MAAARFFPRLPRGRRTDYMQRWSAQLLRILAIRLEVTGALEGGMKPTILVANHVSWLDVCALNSIFPAIFVAKAEIGRWPLIGRFAQNAGAVFIDRRRPRDILRVNTRIGALLEQREVVAVFPEGTTTDGSSVLPFRPPLLQPAVMGNARLQAVAIRYARPDGRLCAEADFTGEKTLLGSLLRILSQPAVHAHLQILPALDCTGRHRRDLAREARSHIVRALGSAPAFSPASGQNSAPDLESGLRALA